jgi:hypothetical protein
VTRKKGVTWKEMERAVKDKEKVESSLGSPLHRKVEKDAISK